MVSSDGTLRLAGRGIPIWYLYVAFGGIVTLLYTKVPPFAGNGWMMPVLSMSSAIAIVAGVRIYRPRASTAWLLMALGQFLFACGDIYTYSVPNVGFPSIGDAIYLAVYPAQFAGVVMLIRRRNPHMERATLIDALILTVGLGVIQWIFLISPYIQDNTLSALPKLVSIAYPTMDTLLLAGALLLAVDNGKRQPAFYMLTGSILCLLFTDFVYGLAILDGTYAGQVWLDWGWIGYYLLWGAAALHPSMRTLEESAPEKESRLSSTRLIVLTAASLIAPIAETVLQARTADIDSFVMIGASAALFLLVVARMAGMVRQEERSVQRERALREAGLALVAAAGRDEIGTATLQAAQQLTGPAYEARLFSSSDDAARAIAGEPETRYSEELPLTVRGEPRGELVVDGPVPLTASQRSALESLATSVSLALESAALTEDLHRRESEARFSSLVARSSDLITVVSADGTVLYQSPSIERVLGYRADDVIGSRFDELLPDRERGALLTVLSRGVAGGRSGPEVIECSLRHRDGRWLQFEVLHTNLLDDEHVRGIVLNSRDVSERRAFEEQLAHQAFHDSLTKLANRALFADRVEHGLARAGSDGNRLAVVFVDLDDFKTINDSLGHGAGDEVLIEVARRLGATVRPTDTAARFGGDEFAVLLEAIESPFEATEVADRILDAFRSPIQIGDTEVFVRCSIGIAITDGELATPDELLRNADVAMYIAKRDGKGGYRLFQDSMHAEALERLEMRADLQRAVDSDQFELHYQPVVRLDDMSVSGVEALIRWNHPTRGVVGPTDFIGIAEDMGLIVPIGQRVLRDACYRAVELQRVFPHDPPLTMSVNLSPRQLNQGDIVGDVRRAIEDSGIDPRTLIIEITESLMMRDTEMAIGCLEEMKALGVRLAMDDFGTGYSSLSYLSRFPVDILKMDRSFLDPESGPDNGLAAAVIALGGTLRLQVVAEGIELDGQMTSLRDLGCELGQGFLFARPMDVSSITSYLEEAHLRTSTGLPPFEEPQADAA